jgi:integrase
MSVQGWSPPQSMRSFDTRSTLARSALRPAESYRSACPNCSFIVAHVPPNSVGLRDKALLLFGCAGASRRSELVAIDRSHLDFVREGVKVVLHRPTNAAAEMVGIPYGSYPETCPVRALLTWLEFLPVGDGPVFRPFDRWGHIRESRLTDDWVAKVVKRYVQSIGMDPRQFAAHSLRGWISDLRCRRRSVRARHHEPD